MTRQHFNIIIFLHNPIPPISFLDSPYSSIHQFFIHTSKACPSLKFINPPYTHPVLAPIVQRLGYQPIGLWLNHSNHSTKNILSTNHVSIPLIHLSIHYYAYLSFHLSASIHHSVHYLKLLIHLSLCHLFIHHLLIYCIHNHPFIYPPLHPLLIYPPTPSIHLYWHSLYYLKSIYPSIDWSSCPSIYSAMCPFTIYLFYS